MHTFKCFAMTCGSICKEYSRRFYYNGFEDRRRPRSHALPAPAPVTTHARPRTVCMRIASHRSAAPPSSDARPLVLLSFWQQLLARMRPIRPSPDVVIQCFTRTRVSHS